MGALKAIVDSNPQRVQEICNQFAADGFTHIRSMLERPDIDAVVIATPAPTHATLTMEARGEYGVVVPILE